jgi:hypothetical protein
VQGYVYYNITYNHDIGLVSGKVLLLPVILFQYTTNHAEVRGEPYGTYIGNANRLSDRSLIEYDGNKYLSIHSGEGYVYGPISSSVNRLFEECKYIAP